MHEPAKSSKQKISPTEFLWLPTGTQAFGEMLAAIDAAESSVRLEMYIVHESQIAEKFRGALLAACRRGVQVKVLVDALGSIALPESFWDEFKISGGEFRWFNPLKFNRIAMRDHRKILVCDQQVAFVGGFNISSEYEGDGVTSGWRDLGIKIRGALAAEFTQAFDEMFAIADFKHHRLQPLRRAQHQRLIAVQCAKLLLSAPGRRNPVKNALLADLRKARHVQIICAYFLPTWRFRRELARIAKSGGRVQLILPAKTDVPVSQLASRSLYRRFLRAGVEIYEYEPQILHAKLFIIDGMVYVGSANLDLRSLQMNYELLVRIEDSKVVEEARQIFAGDLPQCKRVEPAVWRKSRTFWTRLKQRWAYLLLTRLDPFVTRYQIKLLR